MKRIIFLLSMFLGAAPAWALTLEETGGSVCIQQTFTDEEWALVSAGIFLQGDREIMQRYAKTPSDDEAKIIRAGFQKIMNCQDAGREEAGKMSDFVLTSNSRQQFVSRFWRMFDDNLKKNEAILSKECPSKIHWTKQDIQTSARFNAMWRLHLPMTQRFYKLDDAQEAAELGSIVDGLNQKIGMCRYTDREKFDNYFEQWRQQGADYHKAAVNKPAR